MRTTTFALAFAFALASSRAPALQAQAIDVSPYLTPDRAAEVALARTAAPKHVSDSATVLYLTRTGYVEVARGTNGFTCAVIREIAMPNTDPAAANPRVRAPHCFNTAAATTILKTFTKVTEWVFAGVSHTDVLARDRAARASREFLPPAPGAMAYMLSSSQYLGDEHPHWMPHMMFYYDRATMPAARFGAAGMDAPVIDASAGDPTLPYEIILIPVRQWSDGTPDAPHTHEGSGR